jgi:hypothetical protein
MVSSFSASRAPSKVGWEIVVSGAVVVVVVLPAVADFAEPMREDCARQAVA